MRYLLRFTRHSPLATRHRRISAFTLLEMSIVLAIIAVVIAGGMTIFSASLQKKQWQDTQFKLKAIQQALLNFRIANNRLPCPADVTLALNNANYGTEASNPGSCTGGAPAANFAKILTPTATAIQPDSVTVKVSSTTGVTVGMGVTGSGIPAGDSVAGIFNATAITLTIPATAVGANVVLTIGNNVEGMAPVVTLGLPDDYAIDGWGRRIMYAVDNRFTAVNALTPYPSAVVLSGAVGINSKSVTLPATDQLTVGMFAYGNGIPVGDTIANIPVPPPVAITLAVQTPGDATAGNETLIFSKTPIPGIVIPVSDVTRRMTINDASGNPKSTAAAYVLVSFGPNGHGAFSRNGGGTRLNANSDNGDEGKNCDCYVDGSANESKTNGTPPAGTFVQKEATTDPTDINDAFDDVVVYGTRSDLRSPTE